jgi:metallophosphoesterase superfamily enzyme
MKVYLIDKQKKYSGLKKKLAEKFEIQLKESCNINDSRNHLVIVTDYKHDRDYENLKKHKNVITILNEINKKEVWTIATGLKTVDIIDANAGEEYIAERILETCLRE